MSQKPPTWQQGRTFTIEVTEGDLLQMARLSWLHEGGPEYPRGATFEGPRLHTKVARFAPDIARRAEDPITPEDTI